MNLKVNSGNVSITITSVGNGARLNETGMPNQDVELHSLEIKRFDTTELSTIPVASFYVLISKNAKKRNIQLALNKILWSIKNTIIEWFDEQHHCWIKDPSPVCAEKVNNYFK